MENEVNEPQAAYKRSGYITPEEYFIMDEASEERLEFGPMKHILFLKKPSFCNRSALKFHWQTFTKT